MAEQTSTLSTPKLDDFNSLIPFAEELRKIIEEQKLYTNIQSKQYVNVEGWQYAGARLGIYTQCTKYEDKTRTFQFMQDGQLMNGTNIEFTAYAKLIDMATGKQIGGAWASCSNQEQTKKNFAPYAVLSMAETRAQSKAYRMLLAFIMRMAGFEPTPAEEMDEVAVGKSAQNNGANQNSTPAQAPQAAAPVEPKEKLVGDKQKEEIIRLLNYPEITNEERTKMMLKIHILTEGQALSSIAKLRKAIEDRKALAQSQPQQEAQPPVQIDPVAEARQTLTDMLTQGNGNSHAHKVHTSERSQLLLQIHSMPITDLNAKITEIRNRPDDFLAQQQAAVAPAQRPVPPATKPLPQNAPAQAPQTAAKRDDLTPPQHQAIAAIVASPHLMQEERRNLEAMYHKGMSFEEAQKMINTYEASIRSRAANSFETAAPAPQMQVNHQPAQAQHITSQYDDDLPF